MTGWQTCTLYLGAEGRDCGRQAGHTYMVGPRCPDHTPARMAGRPETVPDPTLTAAGLVRAWKARMDQRVAAAEARRAGRVACRTASGPNGRYTAADIDYGRVHETVTRLGREHRLRRATS